MSFARPKSSSLTTCPLTIGHSPASDRGYAGERKRRGNLIAHAAQSLRIDPARRCASNSPRYSMTRCRLGSRRTHRKIAGWFRRDSGLLLETAPAGLSAMLAGRILIAFAFARAFTHSLPTRATTTGETGADKPA